MIFNSNKNKPAEQKDIRLVPEMLNLLGCNKESFINLLKLMNYKIFEKEKEIFFKYTPIKRNKSKGKTNFIDSPFKKLEQLNIK